MTKRKQYDWETIESEYCTGNQSIRGIAKQHGCSETAIRKKAKIKGWKREDSVKAEDLPVKSNGVITKNPAMTVDIVDDKVCISLPNEPNNLKYLSEILGTQSIDTAGLLLNQLMAALGWCKVDNRAAQVKALLPIFKSIAPKDELEGLLAIQMLSVYSLVMNMTSRCMAENVTPEYVNLKINQVTKLNRTFLAQMDALDKHRGKGRQAIEVRHIHVNEGGQAIVGNIEQGDRGDDQEN